MKYDDNFFKPIRAHELKQNQFFFFKNGLKRMVCDDIREDCGIVYITATFPNGNQVTRTQHIHSIIYIYK